MTVAAQLRCAAHPARLAVDRCPVCQRPRCAADAGPRGCTLCRGRAADGGPAGMSPAALTRAALFATPVAVVGGAVASQYVGAEYLSLVVPAFVGFAAAAAAERGARPARGRGPRVIGVAYALVAIAYGFRFIQGATALDVVSPVRDVVPPYFVAAVVAWLAGAPPRAARASARDAGST
ncbi:MAG: hypothetical protein LC640_07270 [Frankia sp.]|nr:hypothetical protein [Frankia sp.]